MDTTREIRHHIKSVENIFKITKAMQTIAASRMRRAQEKTFRAKPFVSRAFEILSHLSAAGFEREGVLFFKSRPVKNAIVLLITPSRGLCGALILNIFKKATDYILESKKKNIGLKFIVIGNKGQHFLRRFGLNIVAAFKDKEGWRADDAEALYELLLNPFEKEEIDKVSVIYTNFISPLRQVPTAFDLLPLNEENLKKFLETRADYLAGLKERVPVFKIEPEPNIAIKYLIPYLIKMGLYYLLWESKTSEHAARMVAMQNARQNAEELKGDLILTYNQARQASITAQVADIIGGTVALE